MAPDHPESPQHSVRLTPQFVVGLMVIAVGLLLTLENLDLIDARRFLRFWPVALILVGLLRAWHATDRPSGSVGGLLFAAVGAWLLLEETAFIRLSFRDLWPTLLVLVGVFLLWQGISRPRYGASDNLNSVVSAVAVLGGVARGNNSSAFRGGELTAVMGGCELDLRHAAINGEAVLNVFALWGGIEVRVPEEWTVVSRVTPILGGVDDKTRPPRGSAQHRLVLRGFIVMAGLEIKN